MIVTIFVRTLSATTTFNHHIVVRATLHRRPIRCHRLRRQTIPLMQTISHLRSREFPLLANVSYTLFRPGLYALVATAYRSLDNAPQSALCRTLAWRSQKSHSFLGIPHTAWADHLAQSHLWLPFDRQIAYPTKRATKQFRLT